MQLMLYGILLSAVYSFCTSTAFPRTTTFSRAIIATVVVLTSLHTALNVNDILHFGTLQARDEGSLLTGTLVEACEPFVVGLIGALVEAILVLRAAKVRGSALWEALWLIWTWMCRCLRVGSAELCSSRLPPWPSSRPSSDPSVRQC